jgi:hypothetical protein
LRAGFFGRLPWHGHGKDRDHAVAALTCGKRGIRRSGIEDVRICLVDLQQRVPRPVLGCEEDTRDVAAVAPHEGKCGRASCAVVQG